ncbi:kinase-like protein [Sporormia fimetaria CBS 119925]|uniref:Kinase-like protein n=1 Tax=Sporormia fimetaria CBS 119925 TaxID=1340428 RepID=A0A6A6V683_9PLEO|nr:kinase-like protein [Sporormia fimetaria CBS 119925]
MFQKIQVDKTATPKPASSTFASIPRDGLSQVKDIPGQHSQNANKDPFTNGRRSPFGVDSAVSENNGDVAAHLGKRVTSITFDDAVTLENGRMSIHTPLPRPSNSSSQNSDAEDSDQGYVNIKYDSKAQRRMRQGLSEPALSLNTAEVPHNDHVASLTSEDTVSPVLEEVRTPPETPDEYMSQSGASAIQFPSYFTSRDGRPQRTRSWRDLDGESTGLKSRRSSARSGRSLSSMSPAASFLARYKASERTVKPPQPDDEGQGIGYDGEYIIGRQVGSGGFSVVKEVTTMENGKTVVHAVKIVRKQLNDKSETENDQIQSRFDHEVDIWRYLHHPNILPLFKVFNTEFATFCITKLNKGGTLFDTVREAHRQKRKGLDLPLVKRYTYQLASAIRYLHNDVMVVHRDIKLENCLVDKDTPTAEQDGGNVLLCDFGMADFIVSDQRDSPEPQSTASNQNIGPSATSTSIAGSLQYAAPELFKANGPVYSTAADIWSFGVVLYALLTANLPFNEGLDAKTALKIQNGDWDAERIRSADALQHEGLDEAMQLLRGCLHMDPDRRWTVTEILACPWLKGCAESC